MTFPRLDHYGYGVTSRDDLKELLVYTSTGVKMVVPRLRPGDRVRITREGKSYPQMTARVVSHHTDYVKVIDGVKYELWGEWDLGYDWDSWLRRNGESQGRVRRLTILELVDDE